MTKRLQGWVAEIIGGTSAIGKPTEELFVANAAKVVLIGRSEDKCAALARRLGDQVLYCHTRLSGAAHDAARDRYCIVDGPATGVQPGLWLQAHP